MTPATARVHLPRQFVLYQTIYRRAIRLLLGVDIPDSTYGFRGFNRTFVQALGLTARRMSVCSEITFKVLLSGGKIERVPGGPTGPMLREQSKFKLGNELGGYALMLLRARLHNAGHRLVLTGVSTRASRAAARSSSPRTAARWRGCRTGSSRPMRTRSRDSPA